jgi:repressor LexA
MAKTPNPTERQREIYDFIRQSAAEWGYPPTVREIGEEFGIRSPNGVLCHLKALEKKGWIERDENVARGIRMLK